MTNFLQLGSCKGNCGKPFKCHCKSDCIEWDECCEDILTACPNMYVLSSILCTTIIDKRSSL